MYGNEYLEIPIEATMPLSSESIGIITSEGHDVNWSCVVCHTDSTLWSVLCVVVCHHQGHSTSQHLDD